MTNEEMRLEVATKLLELTDLWPAGKCPYEFTLLARHTTKTDGESDFLITAEKDLSVVIEAIRRRGP